MPNLYVAGSSKELERASAAIDMARAMGWNVTVDWPAIIRDAGAAVPDNWTQCEAVAADDMEGVRNADALWFLNPDHCSTGAWTELGMALAYEIPIVCSGRGQFPCVFLAAVPDRHTTDLAGAAALLRLFREWTTPKPKTLKSPSGSASFERYL